MSRLNPGILAQQGANTNQTPEDYTDIINSLNLLTNTSDTIYEGVIPTISEMETQLDTINNEIIAA